MSFVTEIDSQQGLVTHTITGELRIEDVRKATVNLFTNPEFRPDMAILVDLRDGTATTLGPADIKELVDMTRAMDEKRGSGRSAILAERDSNFGIGRLIQALLSSTGRKIGVFHEMDEALDWLFMRSDRDHSEHLQHYI